MGNPAPAGAPVVVLDTALASLPIAEADIGIPWNWRIGPASRPVSDETYAAAFSNTWRVIAASMLAYLFAQFFDVRLFHFWKRLTKGRHLWLRNNASTVFSQLLDSVLVVLVLFSGVWGVEQMVATMFDLWLFKAMVALVDTPLFYLGTWWLKRASSRPL